MSRSGSPKISAYDGVVGDDSLSAKDDVLRPSNCSSTADFVARILGAGEFQSFQIRGSMRDLPTVSMNSDFE